MGFQDTAYSLKSRLHMGEVKPSVLIGLLLVSAVVITCVAFFVVGATSTHGLQVQAAAAHDEAADNQSSDAGGTDDGEVTGVQTMQVCVYVSGFVNEPGVYYLDEGARVDDAIQAAGGFASDASDVAINLARVINDGEQINVPSKEEVEQNALAAPGDVASEGSYFSTGVLSDGRVNINIADAAALQTLDGVGEATAQKIIKDREANGPFRTIEDIKRVSGIGDKKFENIKDSICVG